MIFIGNLFSENASNFLPQILMLGGVIMVMSVLVSMGKRKFRRSQLAGAVTPQDRLDRMKQESVMKNDLRTMMVELEELTRRFSSQLDSKSMQLEYMLREADAKVAELQAMMNPGVNPGANPGVNPGVAPGEGVAKVQEEVVEVAEGVVGEAGADEEGDDPLKAQIYELDDAGRSSVEIATALDEHVGKVELILALRGQAST